MQILFPKMLQVPGVGLFIQDTVLEVALPTLQVVPEEVVVKSEQEGAAGEGAAIIDPAVQTLRVPVARPALNGIMSQTPAS